MSKAKRPPVAFGPIPFRAFGDPEMKRSALPLTIIGIVAGFDRFGTGQGCWAATGRIAHIAGVHLETAREEILRQVRLGYLKSEPLKGDRRPKGAPPRGPCRRLSVVYTGDDIALFKDEKQQPLETGVSAEKPQPETRETPAWVEADIVENPTVSPHKDIDSKDSAAASPVASHATASPAPGAIDEKYSAEAAPPFKNSGGDVVSDANAGSFLRTLETWLKALDPATATETTDQLRAWRNRCEQIAHEKESHTGGIGGWAYRLCADVHYLIGELEEEEPTEPDNQESTPLSAVNQPAAGPSLRYGPSGDSASLACNGDVVGSARNVDRSVFTTRNRTRKAAPPRGPKPPKRTLDFVAERERAGLSVDDVAALVNLTPAQVRELDVGRGRWTYAKRRAVRQAMVQRAS